MAAYRSPKPLVKVRVLQGMPNLGCEQQIQKFTFNETKVHPVNHTSVVQWIEYKPAKFMIQVRFLADVPNFSDSCYGSSPGPEPGGAGSTPASVTKNVSLFRCVVIIKVMCWPVKPNKRGRYPYDTPK